QGRKVRKRRAPCASQGQFEMTVLSTASRRHNMSTNSILSRILDCGIVAVVRAEKGDQLVEVAEALLAGGVEAIEVTFTVPSAHRVVERVAERLGDKIVLGAGTVLDPETARVAMLSGAHYIVAPNTNPK